MPHEEVQAVRRTLCSRCSSRGPGLQAIPPWRPTVAIPKSPWAATTRIFSQNKQNEPAVAIDPGHPVASLPARTTTSTWKPVTPGPTTTVHSRPTSGGSGIQFSFNSGDSWIQPTYTGLTARGLPGRRGRHRPDLCGAHPARSGPCLTTTSWVWSPTETRPGLRSGAGGEGDFSWANGSRLYYVNLASGYPPSTRSRRSRDSRRSPSPGWTSQRAWIPPRGRRPGRQRGQLGRPAFVVSKQNPTTFSDKEQIWADQEREQSVLRERLRLLGGVPKPHGGNAAPTAADSCDARPTAATRGRRSRSPTPRTTRST